MAVEFTDNSMKVKGAINDALISWLYEASGELEAQTKRNQTRVDTAETKNAWTHVVDETKGEAVVGNPLENAIWEEFGTGEYALKKNGRKGYWVYVKDGSKSVKRSGGKSYTLEEAKEICEKLKKKGLDAHYTNGKKPLRALENAYTSLKPQLQRMAEDILKGLN